MYTCWSSYSDHWHWH